MNFFYNNYWKQKREELKLTQIEVAEESGLKQTQISNIERGLNPTKEQIRKLMKVYDSSKK